MFPQRSLLAVAISIALPAMAAANNQQSPAELKAVEVKAEVITETQATAQQTQVVSSEALTEQQAQNLKDVVRFVPGVTTSELGGRFGTNGFNIRGMEGDQVAITVDGLSLGETLDPPTFINYEFFRSTRGGIDVDAVKQVEIVKGADAIAAGSGALAGAVMFVTKDPSDYLNAEGNDTHIGLTAGLNGANDEVTTGVTVANRTGKLESLLVYTNRDGNESKNASVDLKEITGGGRNRSEPLTYTSDNVLAKLQYQLTDTQRLGFTGEYYRQDSLLDNLTRVSSAYLSRTGDDKVERKRAGLQYEWVAAQSWADSLTAKLDYQSNLNHGITLMEVTACSGQANNGTGSCVRAEDRNFEQDLLKLSVALDKELQTANARHQLIYGVNLEHKEVESTWIDYRWVGTTDQLAGVENDPSQVPQTDVKDYSIYVRDVISFGDKWQLRVGARYDNLKYSPTLNEQYKDNSATVGDLDFSALTWQTNLQYQIADAHQVWAQLGRGFRAPTVFQMYSPTSTTSRIDVATGQTVTLWGSVSNPDLKAEESLNTEIGYRYQTSNVKFEVSLFQDTYDELIESVTKVQNPGTEYRTCNNAGTCTTTNGNNYSTYDNVGETEVKGVEVSAAWRITEAFSSRFAYSYNEGEKKASGDPLLSINPASAVLGLRYDAANWNTQLNITHTASKKAKDVVVSTPTYLEPEPTYLSDSFTVVDWLATVDISRDLQLRVGIYNLFDEEYYLWSRIRNMRAGTGGLFGGISGDGLQRYSEPGRHARISVTYSF